MKDFTCTYCGTATPIRELLNHSDVDGEMTNCEVENYNPLNGQFTVANIVHCPKCERRFILYAIHKLDVVEINDDEDLMCMVYQEKVGDGFANDDKRD